MQATSSRPSAPLPPLRYLPGMQTPEHLAHITRFFEEGIPFNRFLGLRVGDLRPGHSRLVLPFRPEFIGDARRPALHGGTISMLADTAAGIAVFAAAETDDRVSTIDLRIDYLRPGAPIDLEAEANVVRIGNRVGVARIQVWQEEDGERRLVAEGTGVYSIKRA